MFFSCFLTIDWSTIYQYNYYATNETKPRSFQMTFNLRSIVINVQLYVRLVNLILLLARFLISLCKYSKTTSNMLQYFYAIKFIKQSEHYIAKKYNKLQFYYKNWSNLD